VRLPPGRHFALTWSIPDDFGGMTEAMFRRCGAFARLAEVHVQVLTFDDRTDYPSVEARLRTQGTLAAGVDVVNLYDWLRAHSLPEGTTPVDVSAFAPLLPDDQSVETRSRDGRVLARIRRADDGTLLQIDHLREDGTMVVSDRRDVKVQGSRGGRSVVLCDRSGNPMRSWTRIWGLYSAWLDVLTAGTPACMIVDSKTIARFVRHYRRPHVVTVHVVHASHRDASGDIRLTRRDVLTHPESFDLIAVLSRRQASELRNVVGRRRASNLVVVRNGRGTDSGPLPRATRDRRRGVVVASLTRRKRVSHAIRAVQSVNRRAVGPVAVDIYGEGPSRAALDDLAAGDPHVRLRGHRTDARERFAEASFVLLTAHSEGNPLTLVEAMAAGCLPVAYDFDYGPADIIRHGRNGFLVPAGELDGLADAVAGLVELPERRVQAMRARAARATLKFDDARVTRHWAALLHAAMAVKQLRASRRFTRLRGAIARHPALGTTARVLVRAMTELRALPTAVRMSASQTVLARRR